MTNGRCPMPLAELLAYWLGELAADDERRFDEHLFACSACTERLGELVELGAAIRRESLGGTIGFVASSSFVDRARSEGLRVREYALGPGESVDCIVTAEDDLGVSRLRAPLEGVRRLDVVIDDSASGVQRVSDVSFDAGTGSVIVVPSIAYLRTLGNARQHVRLLAVDGGDERVIAAYTFNHSPSR